MSQPAANLHAVSRERAVHPPPKIPEHRLLHLIGGGGYGEVWLAENAFGTRRAVKVVYRDRFEGAAPYERELEGVRQFEPLSRAHEGLVDVLQVGHNETEGWFHCVMELADAEPRSDPPGTYAPRTLRSDLRAHGRLPVLETARIGLRLAEALEFLHGQGRVHRDVKPSNVVFVGGVPKLADIGLVARTGSTSLVGTDGYIAPEGPGKAPADIYSLGKVLYELATGKDRRDFPEPLTEQDEQPDHAAFAELNQIVVKACDPNPANRYQNATALKQDLLLLLAGRSVREIHRLRARYNRMRRVGVIALTGALIVGGALWLQVRKTREVRQLAKANHQQLVRMNVTAGVQAMEMGDLMGALPWFVEALKLDAGNAAFEEPHRYRIEAIRRQCPKLVQMGSHAAPINHAEFSPDGARLLTASDDGTALVWGLDTGERLTPPLKHGASVLWATFSPDGRTVATAGGDGVARIWDAQTGEALTPPLMHGSNVVHVTFSPDGGSLATASWDGTARLFDARTGQPASEPLVHTDRVFAVAFSPDGRMIATGAHDGEVGLWDATTGQRLRPAIQHPSYVRHLVFSADSQKLVTACGDGATRMWWTASGELAVPALFSSEGGPIWWIAFSPDGRRLVTAGGTFGTSGEVRVWDSANGQPVSPALRFAMPVRGAAFSPDGRWIATGCLDAAARLWEVESAKPLGTPLKHQLAVWTVAFTSDGRRLLTSGRDGSWRLWDLATEETLEPLLPHERAWTAAFSPNGQFLATGGDGPAKLWDVGTRQLLGPLASSQHPDGATTICFSPDGQWLATGTTGGVVAVFGVPSGRPRWPPLLHKSWVRSVRFSPDGTKLATASEDGTAQLWSSGTGHALGQPMQHRYGVHVVCFSPDGRLLATGAGQHARDHARGEVRLWGTDGGELATGPLACDGDVCAVVFSPDGRSLVAGTDDLTVMGHGIGAWDAATGKPLSWLFRHNDGIEGLAFSPDGRFLATGGQDAVARVWRTEAGSLPIMTLRHKIGVVGIAFSPNGRWLLTSSSDGTARLWDAQTGEPLGPPLRHQDKVMEGVWAPDGHRVATASLDGTARIRDVRRTDWSIADLDLLGEVLAGGGIDGGGKIEPLAPEEWRERWLQLKARQSRAFKTSPDEVAAWHLRQVEHSERSRQLEAMCFHLRRLLDLKPDDSELGRRLQQAEQGAARSAPRR